MCEYVYEGTDEEREWARLGGGGGGGVIFLQTVGLFNKFLCFCANSLTSTLDLVGFFFSFYREVGTCILYFIYIGETGVGCNTFHTLPNFSKPIQSMQTTNIPSKQAFGLISTIVSLLWHKYK